jgi:molecular chaperone Hsp33
MAGVVRSIGRNECVNILMERGSIEIVCHFCNTKYNYDKQQVIDIWQEWDRTHKK